MALTGLSEAGFQVDPSWSQNRASLEDFTNFTKLMDASYGNPTELPAGWTSAGVVQDRLSGFRAEHFVGPGGRVIAAFAGTDAKSPGDLLTDLVGNVRPTTQDAEAITEALALATTYSDGTLVFVGHSLGGREASEAAVATGRPAVTLDAAGVPQSTLWLAAAAGGVPQAQINTYLSAQSPMTRAFGVEGETLGLLDALGIMADRWGTSCLLPDPPGEDGGILNNHSIATAVAAAAIYYDTSAPRPKPYAPPPVVAQERGRSHL